MDLAQAVNERLLAAAAVTAIAEQRVTWVKRDQGGELPAIVLRVISTFSDDPIDSLADYIETRVQVDCFAKSHATAWSLARAAIVALRDEATVGSGEDMMNFWIADVEGPIDLGEDSQQGFVHRASVDLILRHSPDA